MNKQSTPRKTSKAAGTRKAAARSTVPVAAGRRDLAKSETAAARKPNPGPGGQTRHEMIAQAAYFNAERRGFTAGGELNDWLEAEREIERTLKG